MFVRGQSFTLQMIQQRIFPAKTQHIRKYMWESCCFFGGGQCWTIFRKLRSDLSDQGTVPINLKNMRQSAWQMPWMSCQFISKKSIANWVTASWHMNDSDQVPSSCPVVVSTQHYCCTWLPSLGSKMFKAIQPHEAVCLISWLFYTSNILCWYQLQQINSMICPCSGVLWMQKLKTHLLTTQSSRVFF